MSSNQDLQFFFSVNFFAQNLWCVEIFSPPRVQALRAKAKEAAGFKF